MNYTGYSRDIDVPTTGIIMEIILILILIIIIICKITLLTD